MKSITSLAGAAIILATLATTTVQARQVTNATQKCEQIEAQKLAKTQTESAFRWVVLGVGF